MAQALDVAALGQPRGLADQVRLDQGAGMGFLSGLVASTGPINTPFFLAYGLVKGAYLSTEALGSMAIGITKAIVFQRFNALPLETVGRGLLIGASLMAGSRLAKGFVLRLDPNQFRLLMDALLVGAGLVLLAGAFGVARGDQ